MDLEILILASYTRINFIYRLVVLWSIECIMRIYDHVLVLSAVLALSLTSFAQNKTEMNNSTELATLGAGCFWCVEAIFQELEGVSKVESGYSGGHTADPTYKAVCSGTTGHAEVVQITFDPSVISFGEILDVFWSTHDPTTLNRQGADRGTQYRSAVFYHSEEQKAVAEQSKAAAGKLFRDKIVTEITPFGTFYIAEDYHQDYFNLNGEQPYCSMVIAPKVNKFKKQYKDKLKTMN
jgi:peptide-methionine (S)-S-oxide reductase